MQGGWIKEGFRRLGAVLAVPCVPLLMAVVSWCDLFAILVLHLVLVIAIGATKNSFLRWGVLPLILSLLWAWALLSCFSFAIAENLVYILGALLLLMQLIMMGTALLGKWRWYHLSWPWYLYLLLLFFECFWPIAWASC